MGAWDKKKWATAHAKRVVEYMDQHYAEETKRSADCMVCFMEMSIVPHAAPHHPNTKIEVRQETTVDAIFAEADGKQRVAALNFASYKTPGGRFLDGSTAQEESLCHAGNLYNILSSERLMKIFYDAHQDRLNRGLYHSDMLYTPDVLFIREDDIRKADIITCAAPNKKTAQKYQKVSDEEVYQAMRRRIDSILYNAAIEEVDTLILGAFGCGVFGNDLRDVSGIFNEFLTGKYDGNFVKVVFAVPDEASFCTMRDILCS